MKMMVQCTALEHGGAGRYCKDDLMYHASMQYNNGSIFNAAIKSLKSSTNLLSATQVLEIEVLEALASSDL